LQKSLPDVADSSIAGHFLRVIGAGRYADDVKARMLLDVHSTCSP
jgi:hypothetical protein